MPVTVGETVGFGEVVGDKPGPVQVKLVIPAIKLAYKVTLPPVHTGPLFEGDANGAGFTITVVV